MNKVLCLISFFTAGILIYQILKLLCECKLTEGYGLFGRVHLDKCCPKGYKFSNKLQKCVHICDGCDSSVYNKLKLEMKQYPGDSQPQLHASFDCDENNASQVYDYPSINRLYSKEELKNQDDYSGWSMNSDFFTTDLSGSGVEDSTAGVQASEEGGNETWGSITGDAASGRSGKWQDVNVEIFYPFEGIPVETYYTNQEECDTDYARAESEGLNLEKPENCIGHWKLDFENPNITYLKDNTSRIFTSPFIISETIPDDVKTEDMPNTEAYHEQNSENIRTNIFKENNNSASMSQDSPVYEYYNRYLSKFGEIDESVNEEQEIIRNNKINLHRTRFCNRVNDYINSYEDSITNTLKTTSIINENSINYNDICNINEDGTDQQPYLNLPGWTTLCSSMSNNITVNDSFSNPEASNPESSNPESDNSESDNILCEFESSGMEIDNLQYNYLCSDPNIKFCQE